MAWLFADSFDFYSSTLASFITDAATHWDTATSSIVSIVSGANTRFSSGQGVNFSATGAAGTLVKSSGSNDAGHHLVFAYKNSGVTTTGNGLTFTLMDATTAQCSVVFDPSGTIYLKSGLGGGTILATYSAGLSTGVWYGIEIEIVINGTTGSFKVRLNGNTSDDFSATGLNTKPGTNAYANKIQIGATAAITSNAQQMDDFLWFSTSGAAPNTWVGDIRAQQLMPTADGTVALTASGTGSGNWGRAANATEDGDTSFVYGSTASVGDLYDIADLTVTPSSIVGVQTRMCARKSDTGTRQARVQIKSGATTSNGSTVTLGTSYSYASPKVDVVDPNTSAAWTASAINSLQIGPYCVS